MVWNDKTPGNNEIFYTASFDNDGDGILNAVDEKPLTAMTCSNTSPFNCTNSEFNDGKGIIPVAILTTPKFDATTVDLLSVKFGPTGATEVHKRGHIEDVDGDGDLDLVLHFETTETGIKAGDTEASLFYQHVEACLYKMLI